MTEREPTYGVTVETCQDPKLLRLTFTLGPEGEMVFDRADQVAAFVNGIIAGAAVVWGQPGKVFVLPDGHELPMKGDA